MSGQTKLANEIGNAVLGTGRLLNDYTIARTATTAINATVGIVLLVVFGIIFTLVMIYGNRVSSTQYEVEGFSSCKSINGERDCNSIGQCAWCIDIEGDGKCQHVSDDHHKCVSITPGITHPYTRSSYVRPFYYPYRRLHSLFRWFGHGRYRGYRRGPSYRRRNRL